MTYALSTTHLGDEDYHEFAMVRARLMTRGQQSRLLSLLTPRSSHATLTQLCWRTCLCQAQAHVLVATEAVPLRYQLWCLLWCPTSLLRACLWEFLSYSASSSNASMPYGRTMMLSTTSEFIVSLSELPSIDKHHREKTPSAGASTFGWLSKLRGLSDDTTLNHHSLNAYLYLRFLKMLTLMAFVGAIVTWPVIFPVNATGAAGAACPTVRSTVCYGYRLRL